jgi:hypothetical protein
MPTQAELGTIRKLSQYRPFERGGRDALEAQEDLLLAALAEAGGWIDGVRGCREAITTLFNLVSDDVEIARALNSLLKEGRIYRERAGFALTEDEAARLESVAGESVAESDLALSEWFVAIAERFPGLSEQDEQCLREDLDTYLRVVIQRHGASRALLLIVEGSSQRLDVLARQRCSLHTRLLHKPIRNPVHQLVGGTTCADDTRGGLQLGEEAHSRTSLDIVSDPH